MAFSLQKIGFKIAAAGILAMLVFQNAELKKNLRTYAYADTKIIYSLNSEPNTDVIKVIENADKYIYFVMYTLTREDIASALIAAKLRGLDVKGVMDFNQSIIPEEKPLVKRMRDYGIEIKTPFKDKGLVHMKMMVTDKQYEMGSYNWTTSATTLNEEVLEIGSVLAIHDEYLRVFKKVSTKYE